jgi:hypothetical protein
MLQAYSSDLDVAANAAFPFNNVTLDKGCGETLSAPASIQLNQRGVYLVEVDGFATPADATLVTAQLYVNGIAQPQAISSFTGVAATADTFGFKTFVQVAENNCQCNCFSSPTVLQVINGITPLTDAHINIVVTKIH